MWRLFGNITTPSTPKNEPPTLVLEGGCALLPPPPPITLKTSIHTCSWGWFSFATTTTMYTTLKHKHICLHSRVNIFFMYIINKNIYLYGFALPPSFLQTQAPSILSFIILSTRFSKIPKPMLPLFLHACLYEFTSNPVLHIQYRNHINILVVRVAADYRYIFKK